MNAHLSAEGARLVGVASVDRFRGAPVGHRPQDFLPDARSVVVIGLPVLRAFATGYGSWLDDSTMVPETVTREDPIPNEVLSGPAVGTRTFWPRAAINNHIWRRCAYEFLNMELQRLSFQTALFLEEAGFASIYMPTTYGSTFSWKIGYPIPNQMAPFSHRHAAVAAGLGTFGLNNLVLTPEYGSLQRFVSVITTAELPPDPLIEDPLCLGESCAACRRACPNGCFAEETMDYDLAGATVRVWRMDKDQCGRYDDPTRLPCVRECVTRCPVIGSANERLNPPSPGTD